MPTVRIKDDVYSRVNKICVDTTIKLQLPVKQGEVINLLLEQAIKQFGSSELIDIVVNNYGSKHK